MRISITGANGFLGKQIAIRLEKEGHHIIAYVRDPSKLPYHILDARYFDLNQPNGIALHDTDILIHNAAYLPKSYEDPEEATKCIMNNGIATLQLLQAAEKAGVKKFIYISSGTVYDPNLYMAKEGDCTYPSMRATYYLTSKLVGDIFTDYYQSKMNIVIIRPSSIYGPNMKPVGLLSRLVNKFKNNEIIEDKDIGNYEIDLVYVDDVAWMVAKAATDKSIGGTLNVGGGEEITTFEVANILASILNKPKLDNLPPETNGHAILDITRARRYGYKPRDIVDGLRSYVASLQ
jgi:UDP-glucose 4-epimerase